MLERSIEILWEWMENSIEDYCDDCGINFFHIAGIRKASGAASALAFFLTSVLQSIAVSGKSSSASSDDRPGD